MPRIVTFSAIFSGTRLLSTTCAVSYHATFVSAVSLISTFPCGEGRVPVTPLIFTPNLIFSGVIFLSLY